MCLLRDKFLNYSEFSKWKHLYLGQSVEKKIHSCIPTSLRDFSVLRFGRRSTSLKSSLMSFSMRGILETGWTGGAAGNVRHEENKITGHNLCVVFLIFPFLHLIPPVYAVTHKHMVIKYQCLVYGLWSRILITTLWKCNKVMFSQAAV